MKKWCGCLHPVTWPTCEQLASSHDALSAAWALGLLLLLLLLLTQPLQRPPAEQK